MVYNRYTDDGMIAADRVVGNFTEWMGAFLTLFWLSVAIVGAEVLWAGWLYVGIRVLYPFLAHAGGVTSKGTVFYLFFEHSSMTVNMVLFFAGATPIIFIATIPGYVSLFFMLYKLVVALVL